MLPQSQPLWLMRTTCVVRLFTFSCLLCITTAYLPQSQIDALQEIYDSLDGSHWKHCRWNMTRLATNDSLLPHKTCGLTIENMTHHSPEDVNVAQTVTALEFPPHSLNGTFPNSAIALPDLTEFAVQSQESLSGHFPNLCSSSKLRKISVFHTGFSGAIPHCTGNISTL